MPCTPAALGTVARGASTTFARIGLGREVAEDIVEGQRGGGAADAEHEGGPNARQQPVEDAARPSLLLRRDAVLLLLE